MTGAPKPTPNADVAKVLRVWLSWAIDRTTDPVLLRHYADMAEILACAEHHAQVVDR